MKENKKYSLGKGKLFYTDSLGEEQEVDVFDFQVSKGTTLSGIRGRKMPNTLITPKEFEDSISDAFIEVFGEKNPLVRCPACGQFNVRIKEDSTNCMRFVCMYSDVINGMR